MGTCFSEVAWASLPRLLPREAQPGHTHHGEPPPFTLALKEPRDINHTAGTFDTESPSFPATSTLCT